MGLFDKARRFVAQRQMQNKVKAYAREFPGFSLSHVQASERRSPLAVKGHVVVETRPVDPMTGKVTKEEWDVHEDDRNLVVTQAESLMAQMSIAAPNAAFNYIELGDPSPPLSPALDNLTLQQSTLQRKPVSSTASGNVVTLQAVWAAAEGNGFVYTESGLFTGPFGAGLMFARKTFNPITKTNAFEMRFTWFITYLVQSSGSDCAGIALLGPSTITGITAETALGGEVSVSATFDFAVGANHVDVFLNGLRLSPGVHYNESAVLTPPTLGGANPKGINLIAIVLIPGDKVLLVHRVLA